MFATTNTHAIVFNRKALLEEEGGLEMGFETDLITGQRLAASMRGLTEVALFDSEDEISGSIWYLNGAIVGIVPAGEPWGEELTAIIEAN